MERDNSDWLLKELEEFLNFNDFENKLNEIIQQNHHTGLDKNTEYSIFVNDLLYDYLITKGYNIDKDIFRWVMTIKEMSVSKYYMAHVI